MKRFAAVFMILILSWGLLGAPAVSQVAKIEKGDIDGASYRIQIPSKWNHGLVMYAHGYRPRGGTWYPLNDALCAVFIAGHSMGGVITLATIEKHPEAYEGALPMCAPLIPAVQFFKEPIFDLLVIFEALFGPALSDNHKPLVEGHCNINPELTGKAFDELRNWVDQGVRPEAGVLR